MVIKQKIIVLVCCAIPMFSYCQPCDNIDKNIIYKQRAVFLLDSMLQLPGTEEIISQLQPKDSALVRMILGNGKPNQDYVAFFKSKGFEVRKINWSEFGQLPRDTIFLTARDNRVLDEYYNLLLKGDSLVKQNKSSTRVDMKTRKRKYSKALTKERATYPILFGMYAVYHYQDYMLLMYMMRSRNHVIPFTYEVCKVPGTKHN